MVPELTVTNYAPLNIGGELYPNGTVLDTAWLVEQMGLSTLETMVRIKALWPVGETLERPNGTDPAQPLKVAPDTASPSARWLMMDDNNGQFNNGVVVKPIYNDLSGGQVPPPNAGVIPDKPAPGLSLDEVKGLREDLAARDEAERALVKAMMKPEPSVHQAIELPPDIDDIEPPDAAHRDEEGRVILDENLRPPVEPAPGDIEPAEDDFATPDGMHFDRVPDDYDEMTIGEVKYWVETHHPRLADVIKAEHNRDKSRITLLSWLEAERDD